MSNLLIPQEVIRKKRDKISLSEEEIQFFVDGLTNKVFSDHQIASMSMAIFINGMSMDETVSLTKSMTFSGELLKWEHILGTNLICDKHSTGGVGDKVSLILAPILAACGVYVPMISGRGLGHTGGTLDKFDSIPGYNTQPEISKFQNVVKNVGCAIIGQTSNLAPADKKLYAIRDIVGTVESIPLITSSILSKKIASGLKYLVLDVKVGNGSFNGDEKKATNLAHSLVNVAKKSNLSCSAVLTDMNQVLGYNAGHTLEVLESIKYLKNEKINKRLEKITNELSVTLLSMVKKISKTDALNEITKNIKNGNAAEKFEKMVAALGGPKDILNSFEKNIKNSKYKEDIFSFSEGFVVSIDTRKLGLLLIELGGGRKKINDKINYSVGFERVVEINTFVDKKTPLLTVHSETKECISRIKKQLLECFEISNHKSSKPIILYKTIY